MRFSLERKVVASFVFALMLLAVIGVASLFSVTRLRTTASWVKHDQEILLRLSSLLASITDVETAQRGYTITGVDSFLEPYDEAVQDVEAQLHQLRALTADDPMQNKRLAALAPIISERMALSQAIINLRRNQGFEAAGRETASGRAKQLHDRIRRLVADMEDAEHLALSQWEVQAQDSAQITQGVVTGGSVLAFGFVGIALVVIMRDLAGRRRADRALHEAQEQLERRVRDRTAALTEANDALRASEERFRLLVSGVKDYALLMFDAGGCVISWNEGAEHINGWRAEEIIGQHFSRFHAPEDMAAGKPAHTLEVAAIKGRFEDEGWRMRKDGSRFWANSVITALRDMEGECRGFVEVTRDMTESRRATQALQENEQRLAGIIGSAMDGIITVDEEQRIALVNAAAEKMFGYMADALLGQHLDHLLPGRFRAVHAAHIYTFGQTNETRRKMGELGAVWGVRADGEEFPIEASISQIEVAGHKLFTVILRDITERRQAEEAIRRQAQLLDISFDAILVCDLEGVIQFWNQGAEALYGFTPTQAIGQRSYALLQTFHPQGVDVIRRALERDGTWTGEIQHRTRDGSLIEVESRRRVIQEADGRRLVFETNRDITARKEAETKATAQLARLALLQQITRAIGERQDLSSILQVVVGSLEEHLPVDFCGICLYDPAANVLTVTSIGRRSAALASALGLAVHGHLAIDANGLRRCVHGQLVYEPDTTRRPTPFTRRLAQHGLQALVMAPLLVESQVFGVLVAARQPPHSFSSGECEFLGQLSGHVALAAHQAQLYSALQQAYDDLRQTQLAVAQQERLRALGQMASGIAHDINNAISPVALYTEALLASEPQLSARARRYLETIQRAIDDVGQTVARMREFYRQRESQQALAAVDLNSLVRQVVDLTRARWRDIPQQHGYVIELRTELAPDLPAVLGVESELREALTNLIFNAVDAMPEGGKLTLWTAVATGTRTSLAAPLRSDVVVGVTDTGIGMDEDTRHQCLEPFFTTKGERGTGLGLAMVYGVVRRHNAEIDIESTVGQGTTVRLMLPVVTQGEPPTPSTTESIVPSPLHILIVDDDPLLIKSLRDVLEGDGHMVVAANSGEAGIAAFRAQQEQHPPFAVVLTDLGMPHVDGRQVASAIKAASPSTPVIMLTGWGQRLIDEREMPSHVDYLLSKPPKLRDLRQALAQCCRPASA